MLVEVAQRLGGALRPGDTCARLGGDEFALLLEDVASVSEAEAIALRVSGKIVDPMNLDGKEVYVQASIGITFGPGDYDSAEEILRDADLAMYGAKRGGLRQTGVRRLHAGGEHDPHGAGNRAARRHRARRVRAALPAHRGDPHRPPAGLRGAHALAASGRGLVAPGEFIPFSNLQFAQPGWAEDVRDVLTASGLDPRCLILEMTESAVMDERGMAGYSSLAHLPRIPIDGLKIDDQFVARMCKDQRDQEVVKAITAISANLDLTVIAEGVEAAEQLALLEELGCDWAQGYYISRPLATEMLEKTVALVEREYVRPVAPETLTLIARERRLEGLDPYSTYLDPPALAQFDRDLAGSFGGIGIRLDETATIEGFRVRSP